MIKTIYRCIILSVILASCDTGRPTITQLVPDPPVFMVAYPLRYSTPDNEYEFLVPRGFVTDLASIPRGLWWWESPQESTLSPAIIHDYLYWQQSCSKDESDAVMYLAMVDVGMGRASRRLVYTGIRTPIAQSAWDNNTLAKANGESRFFTDEYADILMSSDINPDETLADIQNEANSQGGMYTPPQDNPQVKSTCTAALEYYNAQY